MAKTNNTRRMVAMALAAAVTVTAIPVDAMAASPYSTKVARAQKKAAARAAKQQEKINEHLKEIVVKIPTEVDDPATEEVEDKQVVEETFGEPTGTQTGDVPADADDDEYNYEETTQQGKVTVEVTENENGENNVDFVTGVTGPDGENDLTYENAYIDKENDYYVDNELDVEDFLPGSGNEEVSDEDLGKIKADEEDGEDRYELVTQGATSQFRPLPVFKEAMSDEDKVAEYGDSAYIQAGGKHANTFVSWLDADTKASILKDENGNYVPTEDGYLQDKDGNKIVRAEQKVTAPDGTVYYLHRLDAPSVNTKGWYTEDEDGNWTEESSNKKFATGWLEAQQYVLVDKVTGELITVYTDENLTGKFKTGTDFFMENLEDSEYADKADQIRAIAQAGYWGTAEGIGSLDAMKAALKDAGFSDEELGSLTDGVALAATQMAIFACTHEFGMDFVNANYIQSGEDGYAEWQGKGAATTEEDKVALMFKVYNYLKELEGVEAETKAEEIITNDNFLKGDMEITVLDKVDDGDSNEKNDSYTTNLSFALVVTPSTENGDDLVVNVVSDGKVIASGRVAGTETGDETHGTLVADENGNYTFTNIVLTEGDHTYNITMEGIQNLKDTGVYLFTAEVGGPSMIGMTSDKNVVNVESLNFSFEVDDEKVVVREKHKGNKNNKKENTEENGEKPGEENEQIEIDENDVPLTDLPGFDFDEDPEVEDIEIGDEDVPMADAPVIADAEDSVIAETGDSNHMAAGFGGMFAALAGMMMLRKRKEN